MRRVLSLLAAATCAVSALAAPSVALATDVSLSLQGRLSTVAGGPVADGNYALGVSIYDKADAVKPLFYESFLAVPVQGGVLSVAVGAAIVPLDSALFQSGKASFVGVTVGGDPELPRVLLRPTAYAVHATVAGDVSCTACIGAGEIGAAAIGSEQIQSGAVQSAHVDFTYAGSDAKGGAATTALYATSAGAADLAKMADAAKQADAATLADAAKTATLADLASLAKTAQALECTGCVTAAMLAASVSDDLGLVKKTDLSLVATSGKYSDLVGGPDLTPYARLGDANSWLKTQTFGADTDFSAKQALRFRLQNSDTDPVPCNAGALGVMYLNTKQNRVFVCNGTAYTQLGGALIAVGTQSNPGKSCKDVYAAGSSTGSGAYWLTQGGKTFQAWCDMATDGGGWTLVLNLDTSDSHVMWWGNPLWTDANLKGSPQLSGGDHKSEAWNGYANATKVLLVVHENGVIKGWKSFKKSDGKTMAQLFQGGDNVAFASSVLKSDTAAVWGSEALVRASTKLFVNHCIDQGLACTGTGGSGSSDGDRIASDESVPSSNTGGGLGNWHDMAYCCVGNLAGKTCNGGAFRTVSEAQAGWGSCYGGQAGHFGADTYAPSNNGCNDSSCSTARYASPSGYNYDYALYLGED